jgi:putative flippase GtrA
MLRISKENSAIRYVLVGGVSYAIELSILLTIYKFAGLSAEKATAVAFWFGLATGR